MVLVFIYLILYIWFNIKTHKSSCEGKLILHNVVCRMWLAPVKFGGEFRVKLHCVVHAVTSKPTSTNCNFSKDGG